MNDLTKTQRKILSLLEEAGEEDIATLVNTLRIMPENAQQLEGVRKEIVGLLELGFLEIGTSRCNDTMQWATMSGQDAHDLMQGIGADFEWSTTNGCWKWNAEKPRVNILLTNLGSTQARRVLSEDGWCE